MIIGRNINRACHEIAAHGLEGVIRYILNNIAEEITLLDLEMASDVSRFSICRSFRKYFGLPPLKWIWKLRTIFAAKLLRSSNDIRIIDAAVFCGFSSQAHLSRLIKESYGKSPGDLKACSKNCNGFNPLKSLLEAYAEAA